MNRKLPAVILVMGVSGSGKTTIGGMLAERWRITDIVIEKMMHERNISAAARGFIETGASARSCESEAMPQLRACAAAPPAEDAGHAGRARRYFAEADDR